MGIIQNIPIATQTDRQRLHVISLKSTKLRTFLVASCLTQKNIPFGRIPTS